MRLGVDGRKIPEAAQRGPIGSLEHGHELGMDGLFFRTVLDLSPTLDTGELREIRDCADELGMYLETGLGKVNPFAMPEAPELRDVGDGDTLLGFRRLMEACADIGCDELWASTANYKSRYRGRFAYDRFRTDVTWVDQLDATRKFLERLAPVARDLGIHINLETHEEITSFELVRLIEDVGSDVLGIIFDTANVLQRVEHPVWAARRVAPFVRQTHIKDAYLAHGGGGLYYQLRPCGTGVVDFAEILPIVAEANPGINLTIENDESQEDRPRPPSQWLVEIYEHDFLTAHPDLTVEEFAAFMSLIRDYEEKIARGAIQGRHEYAAQPYGYSETVSFIQKSARHVRSVCESQGLPLQDPASTVSADQQGGPRHHAD